MEEGFLLLEVMVAITIMATGLMAALYAFSLSSANASVVQREEIGSMLARSKMTETILDPWLSPLEDQGGFDPDYPQYQFSRRVELVQELPGVLMYEIKVDVTWPSRGGKVTYPLETRIIRRKTGSLQGATQ